MKIWLVLLLICMCASFAHAAPPACTHYASPVGSGSTCSESTPCNVGTWLSSKAAPGGVLCLKDGEYKGDSQMLVFSAKSGTAGSPITIRAQNDGAVLINGEHQRRPIDCAASFITVQGVNAKDGNDTTVVVRGHNCTIQRVVAWSADPGDGAIENIFDTGGTNNLLEDIAGFGHGRKILACGARGGDGPNTVRRGWFEHSGSPYGAAQGNPTESLEVGYNQNRCTAENIIARRNILSSATEPEAALHAFSTHGSAILGSIAFAVANDNYDTNILLNIAPEAGSHVGSGHVTSDMLVQDIVLYAEQSHGDIRGMQIDGGLGSTGNIARRLVAVAPQGAGACGGSGWSCSEIYGGRTLAEALPGKRVWDTLPGICKKVVNREITNEGLWPWPMNERIQAAYAQARMPTRNVSKHVSSTLGAPPEKCLSSNVTPIPPNPGPGPEVPVPPTSLQTVLQGASVVVSWTDTVNTIQTGYVVERKIGQEAYAELAQTTATARSTTDTAPGAGAQNCYQVYARGPAGPSGLSPASCVDVPGVPIPPIPPSAQHVPLNCQGTLGSGGAVQMVCRQEGPRR
jgi:Chondroitinase B